MRPVPARLVAIQRNRLFFGKPRLAPDGVIDSLLDPHLSLLISIRSGFAAEEAGTKLSAADDVCNRFDLAASSP